MKKDKGAAVGLVICFVAMIAIVGAITFSNYERKSEGELAKTEEEKVKIEKAQRIAEKAFEETLNFIKIGVSEREIAAELEISRQGVRDIVKKAEEEHSKNKNDIVLSYAIKKIIKTMCLSKKIFI